MNKTEWARISACRVPAPRLQDSKTPRLYILIARLSYMQCSAGRRRVVPGIIESQLGVTLKALRPQSGKENISCIRPCCALSLIARVGELVIPGCAQFLNFGGYQNRPHVDKPSNAICGKISAALHQVSLSGNLSVARRMLATCDVGAESHVHRLYCKPRRHRGMPDRVVADSVIKSTPNTKSRSLRPPGKTNISCCRGLDATMAHPCPDWTRCTEEARRGSAMAPTPGLFHSHDLAPRVLRAPLARGQNEGVA
ncbi:hypothetical protein CCM_07761 [Cordyceps militaris CM01]|uniref:Uncharacterized protein n=1 Tax=Cordyceps militaris (strain CM01) TaxID=983644 RepID=G3JQK5_CORMM|nr:uncharacterized protein CCM_07761 [Cordyceps militaris CM01]EGX89509.1 hypothetical protein CCM_07761 [Cordyceps militaris CM01]